MIDRWITVDPGEDCGLAVWEDDRLILGWTLKMDVVDIMLHYALVETKSKAIAKFQTLYPECGEFFIEILSSKYKIVRIVCEDWKLYPHVMYTPDGRASHALDWDQCRTARLIGAITHVARLAGIPVHLQGANTKDTAIAAGAENLFYHPLHENRHQNDAIMHGVYWLVIEESRAPRDART